MLAVFIKKKLNRLFFLFCAVTVGVSCAYAWLCKNAVCIDTHKSFYFLVSKDLHTQAGAYEAVLSGGAGYLLCDSARDYVVYQVYFSGDEAEQVQEKMQKDSAVLCINAQPMCFYSKEQKARAVALQNVLACLDGCMQVLNHEIERLELGATQQSSKRTLEGIEKQLQFIDKRYGKELRTLTETVSLACGHLEKGQEGIVYAQKLRYLLCELSVGYLRLCQEYSLAK